MATLPEGVGLDSVLTYVDQPTKTFLIDWNSHQISGFADGLEAMRQAVEIILQNERFRWQIYTADFGSELEELVGEDYDFIVSELPRRIRDAFSRDSRILSADNFSPIPKPEKEPYEKNKASLLHRVQSSAYVIHAPSSGFQMISLV